MWYIFSLSIYYTITGTLLNCDLLLPAHQTENRDGVGGLPWLLS